MRSMAGDFRIVIESAQTCCFIKGERMRLTTRLLFFLILTFICSSLFAQQTGAISGRVTSDNQPLPGVTVEARSNVLPQPRVTVTGANGEYQLPQLIPGSYTLTFTLGGMQTVTRRAEVLLSQTTSADVAHAGLERRAEAQDARRSRMLTEPSERA